MRLSVIGISSWGVTWKRLVEAEEVAWVVLGLDAQQPTVVRAVVGVPQSCRSGSGKFGYTTPDPDGCTSAHDTPASRGQRFRPGRRRDQCRPSAGGGAESGEVVFLCIGRARRELPLLPRLAGRCDGEHLASRGHEIVRVARVSDLGQACVERALQHGAWVIGAQLKPGTEPGMGIVRCVVSELDAQMPATGKADDEHGPVDAGILTRPCWAAPQGGLKAPGQFFPPVWPREDVHVVAESDHDLVGPFCRSGRQPRMAPTVRSCYKTSTTSGHQREMVCVKRLAGASSVVCPCIAVWGWSLQRVIGLRRRRAGLPMMTGEVNDVPQCRGGLAPAAPA